MASLNLEVQRVGNYSYLALENLGVSGLSNTPGQIPAGAGLPPPPLNEAMLGSPATGTRTEQAATTAKQSSVVPGKAWAGWFLAIRNRLNALAPPAAGQSPLAALIEAPSIDETDTDWYALLNAAIGLTDPATITPGFSPFTSRYGRTFAAGDYVLIADFDTYVDSSGARQYRVEIAQIAAISGAGDWTLNRSAGTAGQARFQTPLVTHTPGTIRIYRLIDKLWTIPLAAPGVPQLVKLPWDSMCVAAVRAAVHGAVPVTLNLVPAATEPAVPGFRTLAGAEYTLGDPAAVTLGGTSVLRLSVAGWHSIRNMFFEFDGAAGSGSGSAGNTLITLAYIRPDRTKAYQVATFTMLNGSRQSYLTPQQNTRFPEGSVWPPHTALPEMVGALDANGVLQNGFTIDSSSLASIEEDGELDYVVTSNATTPGVGLRGTVET